MRKNDLKIDHIRIFVCIPCEQRIHLIREILFHVVETHAVGMILYSSDFQPVYRGTLV
jgi:hypothetical protein